MSYFVFSVAGTSFKSKPAELVGLEVKNSKFFYSPPSTIGA